MSTEHLDADELNAFAEGALPAATRSSYVSHLADCHDCRTVASQMVMAAGAGANAQVPAMESLPQQTWWQKFSALISAPALRYAASAVVLLAVVGVAFVVWRRTAPEPNSAMVARNEPSPPQVSALSTPPVATESKTELHSPETPRDPGVTTQTAPAPASVDKNTVATLEPPPPPKPEKDAAEAESAIVTERAMKTARPQSSPSYAPPPPGEYRADNRQREQQPQQNIAGKIHGGPRRNETQEKYKVLDDRARSADVAQGRDEDRKAVVDQPATAGNRQESAGQAAAPSTGTLSARTLSRDTKEEARKSDASGRAQSDEPVSAGGRKFRRQGSVWVDLKFKSSMPVTSVARGSETFEALDSKLRSIAQQLGGEVIVVWKGKAYRIR